jgi:tRNA A-37 threonylcarbamoyl transferase component Bud32
MNPSKSSLIAGLDPKQLFGFNARDEHLTDWEPPPLNDVAKLFPQWQILRLLGRGGMGAVYEARQPELDRLVAIKLLPIEASQDEHQVERFRREARTLAKLRHPGIVSLLEAGITPAGHFFFVMEHVDGSPLSQIIASGGIDTAKAIEIVRQVCDALAHAHAQGVIHRDIKPSNILIDAQGHAKVADFGMARWEQAPPTGGLDVSHTGQFVGTPAYAAPEQVRDAAHVDHRADIYALGVLLYEMLTGDLPRGVFQPPSQKTGSHERLDNVVRRAMQERPEDRYQAADELKKDIAQVPPERSAPVWWWLAAAAICLCGSALWIWRSGFRNETPPIEIPAEGRAVAQGASPEMPTVPVPVTNPVAPSVSVAEPESRIPPAVTGPAVQVWSVEPVSPALQPPDALSRQPWQDAVLIATGGAVLHPDGAISIWHEKTPSEVRRVILPAQAIGSSGNDLFALDREGRLHRLQPEPLMVAEGLKTIFSSPISGTLCALTESADPVVLQIENGSRTPLPHRSEGISRLTMASDGMIWCKTENGEWLRKEGDAFVAIEPDRFPPGIAKVSELIAGAGFTAVIEENGRCTLWGPEVPDSPQRFRLPAGARHLRVGPQTRMAAW